VDAARERARLREVWSTWSDQLTSMALSSPATRVRFPTMVSAPRAYHILRVTVLTATSARVGSQGGSSEASACAAFQASPTTPPPSRMKPNAVCTDIRLKWAQPYAPGTPAA